MQTHARALGELTEAERRAIELEENVRRKDLTAYERSKWLVQQAESAEKELVSEVLPTVGKTDHGGRPPKGGARPSGN